MYTAEGKDLPQEVTTYKYKGEETEGEGNPETPHKGTSGNRKKNTVNRGISPEQD